MPGTAYGAVHNKAVGKRAVVVGAVRADRKDLVSAADNQDLLAAAMANQHAAIREFSKRNPLREIRTMRGLLLRHRLSPLQPAFRA